MELNLDGSFHWTRSRRRQAAAATGNLTLLSEYFRGTGVWFGILKFDFCVSWCTCVSCMYFCSYKLWKLKYRLPTKPWFPSQQSDQIPLISDSVQNLAMVGLCVRLQAQATGCDKLWQIRDGVMFRIHCHFWAWPQTNHDHGAMKSNEILDFQPRPQGSDWVSIQSVFPWALGSTASYRSSSTQMFRNPRHPTTYPIWVCLTYKTEAIAAFEKGLPRIASHNSPKKLIGRQNLCIRFDWKILLAVCVGLVFGPELADSCQKKAERLTEIFRRICLWGREHGPCGPNKGRACHHDKSRNILIGRISMDLRRLWFGWLFVVRWIYGKYTECAWMCRIFHWIL